MRPDRQVSQGLLADRVRYIRKSEKISSVEEDVLRRDILKKHQSAAAASEASTTMVGEDAAPMETTEVLGGALDVLQNTEITDETATGTCGTLSLSKFSHPPLPDGDEGACSQRLLVHAATDDDDAECNTTATTTNETNDYVPHTDLAPIEATIVEDNETHAVGREPAAGDAADTSGDGGSSRLENTVRNDGSNPIRCQCVSDQVDDQLHEATQAIISNYNELIMMDIAARNQLPVPRKVHSGVLKGITGTANKAIEHIIQCHTHACMSLFRINCLVYASARYILDTVRVKVTTTEAAETTKPRWMVQLENRIRDVRSEVSRLTSMLKFPSTSHRKWWITYGLATVNDLEALLQLKKDELLAMAGRMKRCKHNHKIKKANSVFQVNERLFYRQLREPPRAEKHDAGTQFPTNEDMTEFWGGLLSAPAKFNPGSWYAAQTKHYSESIPEQDDAELIVTGALLKDILRNVPQWRSPGIDGVHGYWWKHLTCVHPQLVRATQQVFNGCDELPAWMTMGKTTLLPKTTPPTDKPNDYRPITCLPIQYKIMTAAISKIMWRHINNHNILAPQQRGCVPRSLGCKEHLMFDKLVMEDARAKQRNLHMTFLDFKKAFDSLSHEWIVAMLKMYRFNDRLVELITKSMANWRVIMSVKAHGKIMAQTDSIQIRRGIFQGDTLSPLLFCLGLNPISFELNVSTLGYRLSQGPITATVNHSWYMDDVKLYERSESGMLSLTSTVSSIGSDIGMELNPRKCAVVHIRKGRFMEGSPIIIDNEQLARSLKEGETYKYLGMAETAMLTHDQTKKSIKKEYEARLELLLASGLNARNLSKAVNTYAVPVLTYTFGVLNWTINDILEEDRTMRRMLTAHGFHHPKASVRRLYMKRRDGGRGFLSIEDLYGRVMCELYRFMRQAGNVRVRILLEYHQQRSAKAQSIVAIATRFMETLSLPTQQQQESAGKNTIKELVNKKKADEVEDMALHGGYWSRLEKEKMDRDLTFGWLQSRTMTPAAEGLLMAAQDQSLRTRNYEYAVMKTIPRADASCRICGDALETLDHIVSGCPVLAKTSYIERHNNVVKYVHHSICTNKGITRTTPSTSRYQHKLTALTPALGIQRSHGCTCSLQQAGFDISRRAEQDGVADRCISTERAQHQQKSHREANQVL